MKKRILSFLPAALTAVAMWGVQADPTPTTVVNPDGSVVEVRQFGDEFFSFFTDVTGRFIMERDANGNIVAAMRGDRQLERNESDVTLLMQEHGRRVPQAPAKRAVFNIGEDGRSTFPAKGEIRSLVVLLEYPETSFSVENPRELFDRKCNQEGYSDFGGKGSVRDYFIANSNGQFSPTFDVVGPVKLPESSKYYTGGYRMMKFYEAVGYAIKELDDEVDFSKYDVDGDGVIDTVFFYFAGHGQNDTSDSSLIWPHQWDYRRYVPGEAEQLIVDGVEMGSYACSSELKSKIPEGEAQPWVDGIGTHVHEFSHVLGLPDLYDTQASFISTNSPNNWSVMDLGNYLDFATRPIGYSTYEKYFCRWVEDEDMEPMKEGEEYTLETVSGKDKSHMLSLRVPDGADAFHDEWFFFETRTRDGWDSAIPEEGMIIWHVNYDKESWEENKVNINRKPRWETLHPDGAHERFTWPGADGSAWYLCPDVTTTLKPSNASDGFSVILDDIRYDADAKSVSFGYNRLTTRPNTVTQIEVTDLDPEKRNITISWDPVEGADDYLLTVTCYDEDNWFRTVNGYDEKSCGKNTSVTIENVMEKFWKFEMTATLRVVEKIPSASTSNALIFTPDTYVVSVNDLLTGEEGVRALQGRIEAPAGARIFDLQGRERGSEGLEKGIYLVNYNGKTVKVSVR